MFFISRRVVEGASFDYPAFFLWPYVRMPTGTVIILFQAMTNGPTAPVTSSRTAPR